MTIWYVLYDTSINLYYEGMHGASPRFTHDIKEAMSFNSLDDITGASDWLLVNEKTVGSLEIRMYLERTEQE